MNGRKAHEIQFFLIPEFALSTHKTKIVLLYLRMGRIDWVA